ncbi:XdhC family protein [Kineobactrum salinum]|uniref:XdhC family protein n=1 Tax=Kineobactrum salinum TaxID=2708301 RepID=A0A6C0U5N1_9GAMM|nr:XdhC family protein [Kineobactrum salinum]QIB66729.1 XdhC family protein [Kineobactrum salinum]
MQAADQQILGRARDWLTEAELPVWLCTIAAAVGASPRPPGALLVCNGRGEQLGSLSGGCIEEDLLERLREDGLPGARAALIEYGVSAAQNERLGLPCGGRLQVLVQRLQVQSDLPWLEAALAAIGARRCLRRVVDISTGATRYGEEELHQALDFDGRELAQSFGPQMRLLLVGAGQLSQGLAELALAMDYDVLVTDPRPSMLEQWEGPSVPLLGGMPDDVVRDHASDRHSIVITLTHDPRIDDMALMEALTTPAWYVGALGSRRTTDRRLQRLRQLELSEEQLASLHAPVGLDIGSKTPLEIAVSIMAQLIQLRRQPGRR